MSVAERGEEPSTACADCLRRSWLLSALAARLDYSARAPAELMRLLTLDDELLLQAAGGRRRAELTGRYAQFDPDQIIRSPDVRPLCKHDPRFPPTLNGAWAPRMLNVSGGGDRLAELAALPVAAIIGSRLASDYGMEIAKSLARGLAASGVTVVSSMADGIAVAAHSGALEVRGPTIVVMAGGLDVACPPRRRSLYERVRRHGCAVAELPCGCPARRSGHAASERTIAGLAALTIVVEAEENPRELAGARIAQALGRTVAAVPGRVTARASRGTHELLIGGAPLVRGPDDALELLYRTGTPAPVAKSAARPQLEPRLERVLERVGAGGDTPGKLARDGEDPSEVLLALSELELMGLLGRGDGGRYVPRNALGDGRAR